MLRSEHSILEYDFRRLVVAADRLIRGQHADYLLAAEKIVGLYREGAGRCRQEIHRDVASVTAALHACPPRRTAAFCKLMDDRCEYHSNLGAADLRKRLFQAAAPLHPIVEQRQGIFEHDLITARAQMENELQRPWQQIESGLFADVIELQVLKACNESLTGENLLSAYNVAQFQTVLYRTIQARLQIRQHVKTIVRQIKLAGLMHRIERLDGAPPAYKIWLDGPASSLRETSRYGVRIARLVPALLQGQGWRLDARIRGPKGQSFRASLSPADGLRADQADVEVFDSTLEQEIDAAWHRHPVEGWTWEHETELLCLGQSVLTPDFLLRRDHGNLMIHVEVVGYWTPEYLADKRTRLLQFLKHPDHSHRRWLLILSEKLKPDAHASLASLGIPLLVWQKSLPPSKWIEAALDQ